MITDEQKVNAFVDTLHASLSVDVVGHNVIVRAHTLFKGGHDIEIGMDIAVWREFCRRQLAMPPPLPVRKGGAS